MIYFHPRTVPQGNNTIGMIWIESTPVKLKIKLRQSKPKCPTWLKQYTKIEMEKKKRKEEYRTQRPQPKNRNCSCCLLRSATGSQHGASHHPVKMVTCYSPSKVSTIGVSRTSTTAESACCHKNRTMILAGHQKIRSRSFAYL